MILLLGIIRECSGGSLNHLNSRKNKRNQRTSVAARCVHAPLKEGLSVRPSVFSNALKRLFSTSLGKGKARRGEGGMGDVERGGERSGGEVVTRGVGRI